MHRHTDARDAVAEMAARAQEISQEAGSRIGKAMKDIIGAAAGLAGFAVESARDLAQYMVRRGQMTQEEADKLIREAEEAYAKRGRTGGAHPADGAARSAPSAGSAKKPATKAAAAKKKSTPPKPGKPEAKAAAHKTAAHKAAAQKKKPAASGARTKPKPGAAKKKK